MVNPTPAAEFPPTDIIPLDSVISKQESADGVSYCDDELQDPKHVRCMVYYHSSKRMAWNILIFFLLIVVVLMNPFTLAFYDGSDIPMSLYALDWMTDGVFMADIVLNFCTSVPIEAGNDGETISWALSFNRWYVAKQYLLGGFLIDLISALPFQAFTPSEVSQFSDLVKIVRMGKLLKLARLSKLKRIIPQIYETIGIRHSSIALMKFLCLVLICAHLLGCAFYWDARLADFSADTWVIQVMFPDSQEFDVPTTSTSAKYLYAFYWALTTMSTIGYGDIQPKTDTERLWAVLGICLGAGIFTYGLSNVCDMVLQMNAPQRAHQQLLDRMDELLLHRGINEASAEKIHKFLQIQYALTCVDNEKNGDMDRLPNFYKEQIRLEIMANLFDQCPLLNHRIVFAEPLSAYRKQLHLNLRSALIANSSPSRAVSQDAFVRELSESFVGYSYAMDDIIVQRGQPLHSLFMISTGAVLFTMDRERRAGSSRDDAFQEVGTDDKNKVNPSLSLNSTTNHVEQLSQYRYQLPVQIDSFEPQRDLDSPSTWKVTNPTVNHKQGTFRSSWAFPVLSPKDSCINRFVLRRGCGFGEVAATLSAYANFQATAISFCDVFTLPIADLKHLIMNHQPDLSEEVVNTMIQLEALTFYEGNGRDFRLPKTWNLEDVRISDQEAQVIEDSLRKCRARFGKRRWWKSKDKKHYQTDINQSQDLNSHHHQFHSDERHHLHRINKTKSVPSAPNVPRPGPRLVGEESASSDPLHESIVKSQDAFEPSQPSLSLVSILTAFRNQTNAQPTLSSPLSAGQNHPHDRAKGLWNSVAKAMNIQVNIDASRKTPTALALQDQSGASCLGQQFEHSVFDQYQDEEDSEEEDKDREKIDEDDESDYEDSVYNSSLAFHIEETFHTRIDQLWTQDIPPLRALVRQAWANAATFKSQ